MTRSLFLAAVVIASSYVTAWGQAVQTRIVEEQPAAAVVTPPKLDRLVYSARTSPAQSLADIVRSTFDREQGVRIIAEPVSNSLVISAPEAMMADVTRLLSALDRERQVLQFEVLLVEREIAAAQGEDKRGSAAETESLSGDIDEVLKRVSAAEGKGALTVLNRFALSTVDGQKAMAQLSVRMPRITATSVTARGRANTIVLENIGTVMQLASRQRPDGIVVVELEFQKSYIGAPEEGTVIFSEEKGNATEQTTSPPVHSLTVNQTVELAPGRMSPLFASQPKALKGGKQSEQLLLVGVRGK